MLDQCSLGKSMLWCTAVLFTFIITKGDMFMGNTNTSSRALKSQFFIWTGILFTLFFVLVLGYAMQSFQQQIKDSVFHDISTKNQGYVHTIYSIFKAKGDALLTLRDDLELYETRGQMWVHLAAHAGEKVFDDKKNADAYINSFNKKMKAYRDIGELSDDKITPQLQKMLDNIRTRKNAFGEGMKFFYIGIPAFNDSQKLASYNQYQDSSLWVPDPVVDAKYNPLERPWYLAGQRAGRNNVKFTEPYAERRTKEALISAATAIDIDGVRGTLAAAISIKPVMDTMLKTFSENSEMTIFSKGAEQNTLYVNATPKYIYSSRDASLGNNFTPYNDAQAILDTSNNDIMKLYDATKRQSSGVLKWQINGEDRLVAFDTIPDVGWKIFTSVSKEKMMKGATDMQWQVIFVAIMGAILLLMVMGVLLILL